MGLAHESWGVLSECLQDSKRELPTLSELKKQVGDSNVDWTSPIDRQPFWKSVPHNFLLPVSCHPSAPACGR